jgi:ubiquinone/menaquinone biosynthesis C-methylase UbiE
MTEKNKRLASEKPAETSWGGVAEWYAGHLSKPDSYHSTVILPNLMRIVSPKKGETILDLACGTGFFSKGFQAAGAIVTGIDIGKELIEYAAKQVAGATFIVTPSDDLRAIASATQNKIVCVLAIQNIQKVKETFTECRRVLKPGGAFYIVMNHPVFRIPKSSSWGFDEKEKKQYRRIDAYMTEKTIGIEMHPGQKMSHDTTVSFHRPLQYYFKLLANAGFSVTRLEEWISDKSSEEGPRQKEEDRMRKEIPLFMMIEARL